MAKQTFFFHATGLTVLYHIRNLSGEVWNGAGFVAYNQANFATYNINMVEDAGSGFYQATFPAGIAYGKYYLSFYQFTGGVYYPIGTGMMYHDGTNEVDSVWNDLVVNHPTQGTFGEHHYTVISGSATPVVLSTTAMTTNLTEATDDHYNRRIILFTSGNLYGQASVIDDYEGGTKKITFDSSLTEAPQNGDHFIIV